MRRVYEAGPDGVTVGTDSGLLIYHCNDAIEGPTPQPVEAVRWALVGGMLDMVNNANGCFAG